MFHKFKDDVSELGWWRIQHCSYVSEAELLIGLSCSFLVVLVERILGIVTFMDYGLSDFFRQVETPGRSATRIRGSRLTKQVLLLEHRLL
jgi:hypothetical protein